MLAKLALAGGFILMLIGLYGVLSKTNILRMIIAFSVIDAGVNLIIVAIGYMRGRSAPILDSAVPAAEAVTRVVDPVPQALVLTAIVIGVGVTALMLAFAIRLFRQKKTLEIGRYNDLKW